MANSRSSQGLPVLKHPAHSAPPPHPTLQGLSQSLHHSDDMVSTYYEPYSSNQHVALVPQHGTGVGSAMVASQIPCSKVYCLGRTLYCMHILDSYYQPTLVPRQSSLLYYVLHPNVFQILNYDQNHSLYVHVYLISITPQFTCSLTCSLSVLKQLPHLI